MTEIFPCLTCGKTWNGSRRCHCATCHENFGSVTAFDRHRVKFRCRPPATRAMRLGADTCWYIGEGP